MKKKILTYDAFIRDIINAELRLRDLCYEDLMELPDPGNIDGYPWYSVFTFNTEKEHKEWRNYVLKKMDDCHVFKFSSKKSRQKTVDVLDLNYGLRINY
jgi:hypothetical protein